MVCLIFETTFVTVEHDLCAGGHAQITSAVRGRGAEPKYDIREADSQADLVLTKWDWGHKLPKICDVICARPFIVLLLCQPHSPSITGEHNVMLLSK